MERPSGSPCLLPFALVLAEREAVVVEVKPWDVHGVGYVDVTVAYPDRVHVLVNLAMNMIVGIRRP